MLLAAELALAVRLHGQSRARSRAGRCLCERRDLQHRLCCAPRLSQTSFSCRPPLHAAPAWARGGRTDGAPTAAWGALDGRDGAPDAQPQRQQQEHGGSGVQRRPRHLMGPGRRNDVPARASVVTRQDARERRHDVYFQPAPEQVGHEVARAGTVQRAAAGPLGLAWEASCGAGGCDDDDEASGGKLRAAARRSSRRAVRRSGHLSRQSPRPRSSELGELTPSQQRLQSAGEGRIRCGGTKGAASGVARAGPRRCQGHLTLRRRWTSRRAHRSGAST